MRKYTQKELREFVRLNMAIDITYMAEKELLELKKTEQLSQVGYSCGVYGCNGMLIKSDTTGQYYTIIGRVGNLWLF